jgi:hypothetical protein
LFFYFWNRARKSKVIQLNLQAQKDVTSDSAAIPSRINYSKVVSDQRVVYF